MSKNSIVFNQITTTHNLKLFLTFFISRLLKCKQQTTEKTYCTCTTHPQNWHKIEPKIKKYGRATSRTSAAECHFDLLVRKKTCPNQLIDKR